MSLNSLVKSSIRSQFEDICELDSDTLIDKLDIDEDTVEHLKLALYSWLRSDFGEKAAVSKRTFK